MAKPIDGCKVWEWLKPKGIRTANVTARDRFIMSFAQAMSEGLFDLDTEEDKD